MSAVTYGKDGDGNLFLKFVSEGVTSYLTVEKDNMHLLILKDDMSSIYMDDMPYEFDLSKVIHDI